jgi:hypothetical protein
MRKKIFYGMIVLLGVSLLFLGCSTGTSNDDDTVNPPTWPPDDGSGSGLGNNTAAQAQGVANLFGDGATAVGNVVTIPNTSTGLAAGKTITVPAGVTLVMQDDYIVAGDLVVQGELEVPAGKTFAVASGGSFEAAGDVTVPNTAIFTVATGGKVAVTGTLEVAESGGTINVGGTIEVDGGTFRVGDGATGVLTGTIDVKSGVLEDLAGAGGSLWTGTSTGSYVIHPGVKAYTGDGSGGRAADPIISNDPLDRPKVLLTSGTLTMKEDGYEIDGAATVVEAFGGTSGSILVKAGRTLTVSTPVMKYLVLETTMVLKGEDNTSKVVISGINGNNAISTTYGSILVDQSNTGGYNFYEPAADGTKNGLAVNSNAHWLIPRGPYVWAADADSGTVGNQPGWVRQP